MYEHSLKFVRALQLNVSGNANNVMMTHMKLLYEFWGFCVNGGSSLLTPGGMPTSSYITMTNGFESGSSVLIASGSDGSTTLGSRIFTAPSINWTSGSSTQFLNKHLVCWKSGSECTDDSIYQIVKILNSTSVEVNVTTGGTPLSGSRRLGFTNRTNINFRVVNLASASILTGVAGTSNLIIQMNAPAFNANSAYSQARFMLRTGSSTLSSCGIAMSPSGSWSGTSFSDLSPELVPDTTTPGSTTTQQLEWFNNANAGIGSISFWADQGCLIMHSKGSWNTAGSFFHLEIPHRLYPSNKDPNVICCINSGRCGVTTLNNGISNTAAHYSSGWLVPNPFDNSSVRKWNALVRSITGHTFRSETFTTNFGGLVANVNQRQAFYNQNFNNVLLFEIILGCRASSGSYSLGRVQLRRGALGLDHWPIGQIIGDKGEWIHVGNGVLWPWDNALLNTNIFPFGK